jgi:hypothetical protein
LVSASIRGAGKGGSIVATGFSEALRFVEGNPLDEFVVLGRVAVGVVEAIA